MQTTFERPRDRLTGDDSPSELGTTQAKNCTTTREEKRLVGGKVHTPHDLEGTLVDNGGVQVISL